MEVRLIKFTPDGESLKIVKVEVEGIMQARKAVENNIDLYSAVIAKWERYTVHSRNEIEDFKAMIELIKEFNQDILQSNANIY